MSDDEIDHADCRFRIEIGDSIRRSLIRYFRGWIGEQLKASDAASLSTPEAIDKFAWRLSAGFIAEVEDQMPEKAVTEGVISGDDRFPTPWQLCPNDVTCHSHSIHPACRPSLRQGPYPLRGPFYPRKVFVGVRRCRSVLA